MVDYVLLGKAILAAAIAAGVTFVLISWPVRTPPTWRLRTGFIVGIAAGIYAGCGVVDQWPRWPAPEDRDRFLVALLPLTIIVELLATSVLSRTLAWLLRLGLAAAAAPILLYNSVYLADLSGPNSAEWTTGQAVVILFGLAVLLAAVWGLLARLQMRTTDRALSPILIMVSLATGITVMLSGYYRGGLMGLPVAGALTGSTVASLTIRSQQRSSDYLGISLLGIFTILLIGRFFGSLPSCTAICLWLTPLLAWVAEAPLLRRFGPWEKTAARWIVVALPLIVIVTLAQMKFTEAFQDRSEPIAPNEIRLEK